MLHDYVPILCVFFFLQKLYVPLYKNSNICHMITSYNAFGTLSVKRVLRDTLDVFERRRSPQAARLLAMWTGWDAKTPKTANAVGDSAARDTAESHLDCRWAWKNNGRHAVSEAHTRRSALLT